MNTAQLNPANAPRHSKKSSVRLPRIVTVGAALGIACAAGMATAATAVAATPASSLTAARAVHGHGGGHDGDFHGIGGHFGGGDCDGLIVLLCN
ncbi:hypothetical protein [Streptomyces sp. NPDC047043]|uniref:hypothetical protein n=1 Tax=Streptomyces sp. NPDC047043 TaxID=3154497 RepID=UPI0034038F5D